MKLAKTLENPEKFLMHPQKLFLFDTHCHLSEESWSEKDVSDIVNSDFFKNANNFRVLNVGFDISSNKKIIDQSKKFPSNVYSAIGIHPNNNDDLKEENILWIEEQLKSNKIIAIGEIGLDYYRNYTRLEKQKFFLEKQIILAKKYNLPVLLHLRDSDDKRVFNDCISIIKKVGWWKGLVHCFSGDYETAKKFIDLGFYISFSGTITFKNNESVRNIVKKIPLDKILVETDSPYLSPVPLRGKKNYPWNAFYNLETISNLTKLPLFDLSLKVFSNSLKLFNITN